MDGTEQIETGLVEAEFSKKFEEVCKRRGIAVQLRASTTDALFATILKFEKYLDRVLVQRLQDGPFDLVHQIFPDLFVDAKQWFLFEPSAGSEPVMTVEPFVRLDPQMTQNILRELSAKVKAGVEGKIILPDGYFYCTWKVKLEDGSEIPHDLVIQAKSLEEAYFKCLKNIQENVRMYKNHIKGISNAEVFHHGHTFELEVEAD